MLNGLSVKPPQNLLPLTISLYSKMLKAARQGPISHLFRAISGRSPALDCMVRPITSAAPSQESVIYVLRKLGKAPDKALKFLNSARETYGFKPSSVVYNFMLRILGVSEDWAKDFWILASKMREEGYSVDQSTYFTVLMSFKKQGMLGAASSLEELRLIGPNEGISKIVEIIKSGEEWVDALEEEISDSKLSISDSIVVDVLRELGDHPKKALGFFRWAEKQPGYENVSITYNAMVKILGREETINEFWDLIKEMKESGNEIDIDTYVKLSRRFQKSKMLEHAVRLYEHMMDGSYKPSLQDCALLLRQISLADHPDVDLVSRVVEKFESCGNSLSKSVFDGIHRSLTSIGRFQEADQIVEKMKEFGFQPDNITYSQLIYGLCKSKKLEESRRILAEMESSDCVPDLKTWSIIIRGHCLSDEVDQALNLFTDMVGKGHIPDGHLMDDIVKGLCSQRRVSAAHALVLEMREKVDVKLWQGTLKLLIESFLQEGEIEEALRVLGTMKRLNYPPYGDPFGKYVAKFGTLEDAKEFFKVVSPKSSPSVSTYVKIFEGFFNEGRYDDAKDLLFKCPHHIRKHRDIAKLFGSVKI